MGEKIDLLCGNNIHCVAAGIGTLTSLSDGLGSYIFRRKMKKTQPMREELDGKVFFLQQFRHFLSI